MVLLHLRYICRQFHLTAQRARWSGHLKRDGYLLQEIGLVSEIIFALSFCSYRPIYHFLYIFRLKVTKKTFNSSSPSVSPNCSVSKMFVRMGLSLRGGMQIFPSSLFL